MLIALIVALAVGGYSLRGHVPMHWQTPLRAAVAGISIDHGIRLRMPDGVELATSVYLPAGERRALGTVYLRLPYDRQRYGEALGAALFFARHGYAVVVQDVRGTFESGGDFLPWAGATGDGVATLDWIVAQPWSNGKVGTFGCSALGELQYALARARHPAHAAMIPISAGGALGAAGGRYEYFGVFEGGILQLATAFDWFHKHGATRPGPVAPAVADLRAALRSLPVASMVQRSNPGPNAFAPFATWPLSDPAWSRLDYVGPDDRWSIPTLDINTWGDQTVGATFALADHVRSRAAPDLRVRHHVVIAPGDHCEQVAAAERGRFGAVDLGMRARLPYEAWYLAWFDHWLRAAPDVLAALPNYQFFVHGENAWRASARWPPEGVELQRWRLASARGANSVRGDGRLLPDSSARAAVATPHGVDRFRYDPHDPVPTRGGPVCCTGETPELAGPVDQREVEAREDVLVYTSEPLAHDLLVVGPLRLRLQVSADVPDTDLVARLTQVDPQGISISIQEGALRLRFRDGIARPALLEPGRVVDAEVDLRSIAWRVPRGHRLRLHVTGSSFPRLERNLNTGGDNTRETAARVANTQIHLNGTPGSHLLLPVWIDPPPAAR